MTDGIYTETVTDQDRRISSVTSQDIQSGAYFSYQQQTRPMTPPIQPAGASR